jgi:hypothetical protein
LPATPETDSWLLFAAQELIDETSRQFLEDGGHFEGSTGYHRFCGEMVAVCAAVLRSLSSVRIERLFTETPPAFDRGPRLRDEARHQLGATWRSSGELLPPGFYARLAAAASFTRSLSRQDGSVPQIGDDDSGRFLRLGGWRVEGTVAECRERYANLTEFDELAGDAEYVAQTHANHQQWLGWAAAVLGRRQLVIAGRGGVWTNSLALGEALMRYGASGAQTLAGTNTVNVILPPPRATAAGESVSMAGAHLIRHERSGVYLAKGAGLLEGCIHECFADFGVYIFRSERIHLVIRCGYAASDAARAHSHDDQLAFDLEVGCDRVAVDPGTYVYTASPSWRNRYRSGYAHHAPSTAPRESLDRPLFGPPAMTGGACLRFDARTFVGRANVGGGEVTRTFVLSDDKIEVHDDFQLRPGWEPASDDPFRRPDAVALSPGYGVRYR